MSTVLKKLIQTILISNSDYLRKFLNRHNVELDEYYYSRIDELHNRITEVLKTTNNKDTSTDASTLVYTYITACVEEVWASYNVPTTKPISWSVKKIKRHSFEASQKLQKSLDSIFIELEKYAINLETFPDNDDAVYTLNDDVVDLSKRNCPNIKTLIDDVENKGENKLDVVKRE